MSYADDQDLIADQAREIDRLKRELKTMKQRHDRACASLRPTSAKSIREKMEYAYRAGWKLGISATDIEDWDMNADLDALLGEGT